jgi:GPH family glycoside/pentoside/hexuronide:cation symporter
MGKHVDASAYKCSEKQGEQFMKKTLSGPGMVLYALGIVGVRLLTLTLSMYTLRFFAPTQSTGLPLLLPIGVIGVIQGLTTIVDCLIDPWIANYSDNLKNPKGRRIPMMRKFAVPAAFFCLIIFFTPVGHESRVNVIWVVAALFLYCICRSLYDINYQAFVPELIPDPKRRTNYFSVRAFLIVITNLVTSSVPALVVVFRGMGVTATTAWRMCIAIFPVLSSILMLLPALLIKETDYVEKTDVTGERISVLKSLKGALSIREFRFFMGGALLIDFAAGCFNATLLFYIDLLFGLPGTMATILFIGLTLLSLTLYPFIVWLSRRLGKRKMMLISISSCTAAYLIILLYVPLGVFFGSAVVQPGGFWAGLAGEGARVSYIIILFLVGAAFAYPLATSNIIGSSMYADFAHYDMIKSGQNRSGMFFAVLSIIQALPGSLVPAVVGLVIYMGSVDKTPTVTGVYMTAVISLVANSLGFLFYWLYNERNIFSVIFAAKSQEQVEKA